MTEPSIIESEKVFREFFDNMSSGVAVYHALNDGENFSISDINKMGERISKVKRDDVVGNLVTEVFPGIKDIGLFKLFQDVWRTGKSERHPISLYQDDRITRWVENFVYKLPSGLLVAIYDDVTEKINSELALKESEERFRETFEQAAVGIAHVTPDGSFLRINQRFCDIIGYTREEMLNKSFQDITHPDDLDEDLKYVRKMLDKEISTYSMEKRYYHKNGSTVWVNLTVALLFNHSGEQKYFISVIEDITDKKRTEEALKESEEKLKILNEELEQQMRQRTNTLNQMIELNPYAIALYDLNGFFIRGNKAFIEYFKTQAPKDFTIFNDPILKKAGILNEINSKIKNGEIVYVPEIWYNPHSLSSDLPDLDICFRTTIFPILNDIGEIENIVLMFDDVTERALAERKLKDSEEKYRKAYFQANLYRDIFAHDINNILQNIHSSAELTSLYLNNPEKLNTISELYEIIHEQVERGRKLIRNVRKINEIDDSEVELVKIEAFKLLNNATEFLKNSFQARSINIKINTKQKKAYVIGNNLLLDVFENILINAVRHNNSIKIKITIDIREEKVEDKCFVRMEFKDNGLGISDYRKKSIFEKGTRKSQRSRGMGLGLSLVKKIIDSYHGDIWVEDRVKGDYKQGSNFVILLQKTS
ncbi:MAG: PAS domain S-box protein [Promethearchaeota archaeon]|jgi:PAS domain S-box-containing protein